MSTPNALQFRDMHNACHESSTMRLTPGTACGCQATCAFIPAQLRLIVQLRPLPVLPFSSSRFLCSPCTPHATRRTLDTCGCSSWLLVRRFVQHSTHTSKPTIRNQHSFRATRHTPHVQRDITNGLYLSSLFALAHPYERALQAALHTICNAAFVAIRRCDSTFRQPNVRMTVSTRLRGMWQRREDTAAKSIITNGLYAPASTNTLTYRCLRLWPGATLTLSLLGSSLRPFTVPMNQRSGKASRRVRTTLYRIGYAWNEGSPGRFSRITPLGTPLMECIAYLGQGGDASRVASSPTLRPLLLSSPTVRARTHRTTPILFKKAGLHEWFSLGLRSAASKPHFSKYIGLVVLQPHTTKSLTGGVLRTLSASVSCSSYVVSSKGGIHV